MAQESPSKAIMLLLKKKGGMNAEPTPPEDDTSDVEAGEGQEEQILGKEFLQAIDSGDPSQVVEAFEALFNLCESNPHNEGGE